MRRRKFRLARTSTIAALAFLFAVGVAANRDDVVQAQRLESVSVSIAVDGVQKNLRTAQTTVGSILEEMRIEVGPLDVVTPATDERPYQNLKITVVRVKEEIKQVNKTIPFETVKTFSTRLRPGAKVISKKGQNGAKMVLFKVRYEDGKEVKRTVIESQLLKEPVKQTITIGSAGRYVSRGEFRTLRVMKMMATAYDPGPGSCGKYATGRTSCGLRAGKSVVAVDPKVIPLGTKLYIEGYGYAVAGDVGGAIKGKRIDLGYNSRRDALRFGRKHVQVHILQKK